MRRGGPPRKTIGSSVGVNGDRFTIPHGQVVFERRRNLAKAVCSSAPGPSPIWDPDRVVTVIDGGTTEKVPSHRCRDMKPDDRSWIISSIKDKGFVRFPRSILINRYRDRWVRSDQTDQIRSDQRLGFRFSTSHLRRIRSIATRVHSSTRRLMCSSSVAGGPEISRTHRTGPLLSAVFAFGDRC